MREAPSRVVIDGLLARGATVTAFDPVAMDEAEQASTQGEKRVAFAGTALQAAQGADALLIVTEWKAFRSPDFDGLRAGAASTPVIFDGRNLYEPADRARAGLRIPSRSADERTNRCPNSPAAACSWWATSCSTATGSAT